LVSVSIIIAFYNNEDSLSACIQSAIDQEIQAVEIILIDNNSTDNSLKIAEDFKKAHNNIQLFSCKEQGSAFARNLGLSKAKNDYIQFLDADDLLLNGKIRAQLDAHNTMADILVSPYEEIADGRRISYTYDTDVWAALIQGKLGITSANLFKRSALNDIGGWAVDIPNHQDYELMFRLLQNEARVAFINSSLTIKQSRSEDSISAKTEHLYPKTGIELRESMKQFMLSKKLLSPKHETLFLRYFYDKITWLNRFEPTEANKLYKKYFSNAKNRSVIPMGKRIVESIFGFSGSRRIKNLLLPK